MDAWRDELTAALGPIARDAAVGGGDINDAHRVELASGERVFVKSHASPPPGLYAAEAAGLDWLRAGPLRIPRVRAHGDHFLALEWIDLDGRHDDEALGRGLAALHAIGAPSFGLDRASYIAILPQDNTPAADVPTFYVERRLRPLVPRELHHHLDALLADRDVFGPPERPARLHGDLWWGNVGFSAGGPVLVDPAVYGGHREIDLAMLALFGAVSDRLVAAYDEVWPLAPGWRARVSLWQLYPIAVHARLFGGSYTRRLAQQLAVISSRHG